MTTGQWVAVDQRVSDAEQLATAERIARRAHAGQTDKAGKPYIDHPFAVARSVRGIDRKIVALLHDVVEDSDYTLDDLRRNGISQKYVDDVDALTKRKGEKLERYWSRVVRRGPRAVAVKKADVLHNLSRNGDISDEETAARLRDKYTRALIRLSEAQQ